MDKQQPTTTTTATTTSITIRIPAEIAAILRALAKQHDRSLNGEIVRALRAYAEKYEGEK